MTRSRKSVKKKRARKNPQLVIFGPNPRKRVIFGKRVEAIYYVHAEDGQRYVHEFETAVQLEALADGSLRVFSPRGKKLWGEF